MEIYQDKFIDRLREFIKGRSILAFSKEINIPERTLNSWVNKKSTPCMEYIIKLAIYFGCTTDYLLGLVDY